jgi:GT2 family glycosyltransferase
MMPATPPLFSIVIPTHQRPARLASCLQAVEKLDYPRDRFEVVVVDDGTRPEGSVEAVLLPHRETLEVRLVRQHRAGPAAARNAGAERASGDFLAFTDDDCRPRPGWLSALAKRLADAPDALVGGRVVNGLTGNACSAASQVLIDYISGYYLKKGAPIFPSNNLAIARGVFRQLGGFDPRFPRAAGEDREFCDRGLARGVALLYAPDAVVEHSHDLTLRGFVRQHFHYGCGAWHYHRIRAQRGSNRIRLEPLRFYSDLVRAPFRLEPRQRRFTIGALLILSQIANAAGFFLERAGRGRRGKREAKAGPEPECGTPGPSS